MLREGGGAATAKKARNDVMLAKEGIDDDNPCEKIAGNRNWPLR